jgi:hypothetical protein
VSPSTPLLNPIGYFRRHDRPSLTVGVAIVFIEATAISIAMWLFLQRVMERVDTSAGAEPEIRSAFAGAAVGVFVAVFAGWLLLAAIVHVFLWFADADEGFWTTLAVVGEAELVGIALLPVTAFGLFSLAGHVPSDPAAAAEYFQQATSFSSPLLLLSSLVGTLWKAAIQGLGLSESHDVDPGNALALTFVVGVVGFLLNLA